MKARGREHDRRDAMTEIIAALDVDTLTQAEELLDRLHGTVTFYKIGMRFFTAHGRRAIDLVHKRDGRVFLDLKLFDIPETTAQTVRQAQKLGVFSVSIHLGSGSETLKAATEVSPRPKLWGVTVLTSMTSEDLRVLSPDSDVLSTVERLAKLGKMHHIDAVICSPHEVLDLRRTLGPDACFVTPGIRPAGSAKDDQRRIMTPADAARLGIRYIVVGRPITRAADPLKAAQDILRQMQAAAPGSLTDS